MQRREFFRSLVAGGAAVTDDLAGKPLKHRKSDKQRNTPLYHGPMVIPADVAECLREDPALHKTRTGRMSMRYVDSEGTIWLMMSEIPASREMQGEICRTAEGRYRVHCWYVARPGTARRDAREIIDRSKPQDPIEQPDAMILPPAPDFYAWTAADLMGSDDLPSHI